MNKHIWLYVGCFLIISACATAPLNAASEQPPAAEMTFTAPTAEPANTPQIVIAPTSVAAKPEILESRRLTLEFPPKMRAGVEGDVVRLTLEIDNLGNITPTGEIQGNTVEGQMVQIPNLYETHNVTAEARLDLAGMEVSPSEAIFEPLKAGQAVIFYWSIRPSETGTYRGTVWLHLNFENRLTGEKSRLAVSAQIIEIEAVDFFGLSVNVVRTTGVVGSVIGGVIGFPFLEDILKFLFRKKKRK